MLVTADTLALAHAGDCRALLVKRSGSPVPFVELTIDHSAENHPLASGACSGQPCRPDEVLRVLGILEERVGPIEDGDDDDDQTPMALLTRIEHMCYGESPEGDFTSRLMHVASDCRVEVNLVNV